jgi:MYXO-CTERM domain-containing protein
LRSDPGTTGTVEMSGTAASLNATIPAQKDGEVVQYRVLIDLADGSTLAYPENAADPLYEFFVGAVEPLYCTDFEKNPEDEGWTHGLTDGPDQEGADDWQWGVPQGRAESGDPAEAYSGKKVWANDLGSGDYNGSYQPDVTNFTLSPSVDTKGATNVRLQYRRWLNVEDNHFDAASIYANDTAVWTNFDSDQGDQSDTHHRDKEWRFQDVDLTPYVKDGAIQVKFEIDSDPGLELGGWTLDDFCIVSYKATSTEGHDGECGNGVVELGEACDTGDANSDTAPDACRTTCEAAGCGDGVVDSGEACDDANANEDDGCTSACTSSTIKANGAAPGEADADSGCACRSSGAPSEPSSEALWMCVGLAFVASRRRQSARRR